jgi:hypothetical protein
VSPALRRALHQALDLVLDAAAAEARDAAEGTKRKRRPYIAKKLPPMPENVTAEELTAINARVERARFVPKKAG